jgi:hypothetical protein
VDAVRDFFDTVTLRGQVLGVAAPGPDGPIIATSCDGDDLLSVVLTAVDLSGTVLWERRFDGQPSSPRISDRGTVWVAHRDGDGYVVTELDLGGSVLRTVVLEHEANEHLGAFVVVAEDICVAWLPAEFAHIVAPGRVPRVSRYGGDGRAVRSTDVDLGEIAQHTVVTDGQVRWKRRRPRTIVMAQWQPLMVSADRVAATYEDYSSGVCVTFFLDTASGEPVSQARPTPQGLKAIVAPGEFLIGTDGYSASSTTHYDRSGQALQQWASHGMMLVDRHGGGTVKRLTDP